MYSFIIHALQYIHPIIVIRHGPTHILMAGGLSGKNLPGVPSRVLQADLLQTELRRTLLSYIVP